jgi:hypothetical protein
MERSGGSDQGCDQDPARARGCCSDDLQDQAQTGTDIPDDNLPPHFMFARPILLPVRFSAWDDS